MHTHVSKCKNDKIKFKKSMDVVKKILGDNATFLHNGCAKRRGP
jgi:hypothetical protein